jgi:hypothetical protein
MKIFATIVSILLTVSALACGGMDKTTDRTDVPPITSTDTSQKDG